MTSGTEFETRLAGLLHERAEKAMNRSEILRSVGTQSQRRPLGLVLAMGSMGVALVVGLVAIAVRNEHDGQSTTSPSATDQPTSTTSASVGIVMTLDQASQELVEQCRILRQHQVPERLSAEDALGFCQGEVGPETLSQFSFLTAEATAESLAEWVRTLSTALADCFQRAGVAVNADQSGTFLDVPVTASADVVEGCWKYGLIEIGLVDTNLGTPAEPLPTSTSTDGANPTHPTDPPAATTTQPSETGQ